MIPDDVSIVYIRRTADVDLREIVALAAQYYAKTTLDFLVLDMSRDDGALSLLAGAGDPFRYLVVPDLDFRGIVRLALKATQDRSVIFIDDLIHGVPRSAYGGRDVRFLPTTYRP